MLPPTLVIIRHGRITVDGRTKSPLLNKRTFALPFLSAFRFWLSTASVIVSCKIQTTVMRAIMKTSAEMLSLSTVLLECTAARSLVASVSVSSDALGLMLI